MKTCFIGGGVMTEAIIKGAIGQGVLRSEHIHVGEPLAERRAWLSSQYGVTASSGNRDPILNAELVVLAIKPQQLTHVLPELKDILSPNQTILSIVAGATIQLIQKELNHLPVIRVMPNTPSQIGSGISVWTSSKEVEHLAKNTAESILSALGTQIYVEREDYLDMATAVSGSGPAYVFAFMESLTAAAVELGIPEQMAKQLVVETVLGSANLIKETGEEPSKLRSAVTSRGGTTESALLELERYGFQTSIRYAVKAAHEKARSIGSHTEESKP